MQDLLEREALEKVKLSYGALFSVTVGVDGRFDLQCSATAFPIYWMYCCYANAPFSHLLPTLHVSLTTECRCLLLIGLYLGLNCVSALLCFHYYKYVSGCLWVEGHPFQQCKDLGVELKFDLDSFFIK